MGLLHDIGKYQESFQQRIDGEYIQVEHSICGAITARELYPDAMGLMMAYCIAGHHTGIPDGGFKNDVPIDHTLCGRLKGTFEDYEQYKEELQIPELKSKDFLCFMLRDCEKNMEILMDKFSFFTRYAFSCLIDADYLDTSRFQGLEKESMLYTDFCACNKKFDNIAIKNTTLLKEDLFHISQQIKLNSNMDGEIFFMNVPQGGEKALILMKFALERAIRSGKKRVIYVSDYNYVLDQAAKSFEELFGEHTEILRQQSTFSSSEYTENWDVQSIIITTTVQFFESIFSNKPEKLRKMHNMADSILIFDEAYMIPQEHPCLRTVSFITKYLHSEAIFSTAIMPDMTHLFKTYGLCNSKIIDLDIDIPEFSVFQNCSIEMIGSQDTESILNHSYPSSLIIVNEKKTAKKLYEKCCGKKFHLSTYLATHERNRIIQEIQMELKQLKLDYPNLKSVPEDRKITIISTAFFEIGRKLEVAAVFRELTALEHILHAGFNRQVFVFEFNETRQDVKRNVTWDILQKYENAACPQSIKEYYDRVFDNFVLQKNTITETCYDLSNIPFASYARDFKLIHPEQIPVAVPCDDESASLINALKKGEEIGNADRILQMYTCLISMEELDQLKENHLVEDYGIWCLLDPDHYDVNTGIVID